MCKSQHALGTAGLSSSMEAIATTRPSLPLRRDAAGSTKKQSSRGVLLGRGRGRAVGQVGSRRGGYPKGLAGWAVQPPKGGGRKELGAALHAEESRAPGSGCIPCSDVAGCWGKRAHVKPKRHKNLGRLSTACGQHRSELCSGPSRPYKGLTPALPPRQGTAGRVTAGWAPGRLPWQGEWQHTVQGRRESRDRRRNLFLFGSLRLFLLLLRLGQQRPRVRGLGCLSPKVQPAHLAFHQAGQTGDLSSPGSGSDGVSG